MELLLLHTLMFSLTEVMQTHIKKIFTFMYSLLYIFDENISSNKQLKIYFYTDKYNHTINKTAWIMQEVSDQVGPNGHRIYPASSSMCTKSYFPMSKAGETEHSLPSSAKTKKICDISQLMHGMHSTSSQSKELQISCSSLNSKLIPQLPYPCQVTTGRLVRPISSYYTQQQAIIKTKYFSFRTFSTSRTKLFPLSLDG